jgi:hypothetical protein
MLSHRAIVLPYHEGNASSSFPRMNNKASMVILIEVWRPNSTLQILKVLPALLTSQPYLTVRKGSLYHANLMKQAVPLFVCTLQFV